MIYGVIASAITLAGMILLLLQGKSKTVIFPEFSASDVLDGKSDCCINALQVLDRYAEEANKQDPSELFLVSYSDRDDREVLMSLLVEADEPLYEQLSAYYSQQDGKTALAVLSGYFICEPLDKHNADASAAFEADATDYAAWKSDSNLYRNPVVLRYAGESEEDYHASVRKDHLIDTIVIIVLFAVAAMCGIRVLTLRETKTA